MVSDASSTGGAKAGRHESSMNQSQNVRLNPESAKIKLGYCSILFPGRFVLQNSKKCQHDYLDTNDASKRIAINLVTTK
jgi:hypothetical protein